MARDSRRNLPRRTSDASASAIIPTMRYRDAPAAIVWLCRAFGFEKHLVVPGEGGTVIHAQLTFRNGMIMLGSSRDDEFGRFQKTPTQVGGTGTQSPYIIVADADAHYEAEFTLDVSRLEPQVALPGGVQNAVNLSEAAGTAVDHAFVGSCGSGMWDDLVQVATVLKGRHIASNVRLFIAPGTEESTKRLSREGLMQIFIEAGAIMLPAGCGPCNDAVIGPLHAGEVSISTATNNPAGRFGARDARLYLGSPATVAASAVTGKITDPREFMVMETAL